MHDDLKTAKTDWLNGLMKWHDDGKADAMKTAYAPDPAAPTADVDPAVDPAVDATAAPPQDDAEAALAELDPELLEALLASLGAAGGTRGEV